MKSQNREGRGEELERAKKELGKIIEVNLKGDRKLVRK